MSVLLSSATSDEYAKSMAHVTRTLARRFSTVTKPSSGASIESLAALVGSVDLDGAGIGTEEALDEIDRLVTEHAVWYHHPAYLAHLNCPIAIPAVAADAVLSAVNISIDTWDQSKTATFVERRLVRWTAEQIGFSNGSGIFTSGGTQSNLHALLLAREAAVEQLLHVDPTLDRHEALSRMCVYAGASAHFSIRKACFLLGLNERSVIPVDETSEGRMSSARLLQSLREGREAGRWPMAVVATAGTTDRGCVDRIDEVGEVTRKFDAWLHVDAAYGCGLLLSPTRRDLLKGIESARSVTVDYHKSFFQPVSSSAIIVNDAQDLVRGSWHADYLNPPDDDEPNQVDVSLQTTRRADALKLWVTLRAVGPQALGLMIDRVIDTAAAVHLELESRSEIEVIAPTDLSTVLFRVRPLGATLDDCLELVPLIREELLSRGTVHVAKTIVEGLPCLKLTLLNPEVSVQRILQAIDEVIAVGRDIIKGNYGELRSVSSLEVAK